MKCVLARSVLAALVFGLLLLAPSPSYAAPISGNLAIAGDAQVGATFLNFLCDIVAGQPCPSGYGDFLTSGPAALSGSFVPYAGDTGFIHSLNQTLQPLNENFNLSNFLEFNPMGTVPSPDIAFDLQFIFLGTSGQAQCAAPPNPSQTPAQTCTPIVPALMSMSNPLGLSPFNLANTPTGSTASFVVSGTARRISTGETSKFTGTFSATFTSDPGTTDASYQALLAQFMSGGTITSSYSATFRATVTPLAVPEPATAGLVFGGLMLAGLARFRGRFRRSV